MELEKEYEFDDGTAKFLKSDILLIRFNSKKRVTVKDVTGLRNLREELIQKKSYYPIIDCRDGFVNFTSEAKAWVAVNKESADVRIMDIILVNNWASKLEVTLYLRLFKPINETKIASSIRQAFLLIEKDKESKEKEKVLETH